MTIGPREALESAGFRRESEAVQQVRERAGWSRYVAMLFRKLQRSVARYSDLGRLRFLLYSSRLLAETVEELRRDDRGIVWL